MGNPTDTIPIVEYDDFPTESLEDLETLPSHHIGAGAIERAFCRRAHRALSCAENVDFSACPQYARGGQCGLTQNRHPCIFLHINAPEWDLIRQSATLEPEAIDAT